MRFPGRRVPGEFSAEAGEKPTVSLDAALIDYPREDKLPAAIRELGIPEAALAAAAYRPITRVEQASRVKLGILILAVQAF